MNEAPNSRAYQKAKSLVSATLNSPKRLLSLASRAQSKASKAAGAKIAEVLEPLKTSYRLLSAYAGGSYRDISLEDIGLIVAGITYFVMPIDSLPDFIIGLGLTDDAAVLAWTFSRLKDELTKFKKWEAGQED